MLRRGLQAAFGIVLVISGLVLTAGSDAPNAIQIIEPTPVPATVDAFSATFPGYYPQQIRRAYRFDRTDLDGSGSTIAIVTAYGVPSIGRDASVFSATFGLPALLEARPGGCTARLGPHPCLERLGQPDPPRGPADWALDATMAVEWTHSIAPGADILLVLADRATFGALADAVDLAVARGARIVVMSWSAPEFAGETEYDSHFQAPGVTFVAAAGDRPGVVTYPAASPWVIAVGGTTLVLDAGDAIARESPWPGSGWGASDYERPPPIQAVPPCVLSAERRSVPDVAYAADPRFGFAVYDSSAPFGRNGWFRLGGTSAGAPQWAGLLALARQAAANQSLGGSDFAPRLYHLAVFARQTRTFRRPTEPGGSLACAPAARGGWYAPQTGLGSPIADQLIRGLAGPS